MRLLALLRRPAVLRTSACVLGAMAIVWICTYKIMDRDFWWHITAGKILLTEGWISLDPFAYTRAGMPYVATHEWLAQIILSLIYRTTGSTGIILFRGVIAIVSTGLLLRIAPRRIFPNILLAVWAVVIAKGSFLERPQLFTFVFVCAFLLLAFRFLDATTNRRRLFLCSLFTILLLLWVNMHGGAALVGCAIVGMLLLDASSKTLWRFTRKDGITTALLLLCTLGAMCLAIIAPPNGRETLHYVWNLLHDETIVYIAEWQAPDWATYIRDLWPFWIAAVASLCFGKRHLLFSVGILAMSAYLSWQANRHGILFIFTALAVCFYQLDHSPTIDRLWQCMSKRQTPLIVGTLVIVTILSRAAWLRSFDFELQDHLFGFGQFDLARGATDFLERERITGNMFNTYGIGGYLISRGYPNRKVFIDGRNVDYGMDFMTHAYAAGVNAEEWKKLTERYNITYAIIDYDAIREKNRLPYSWHLDSNPDWPLVYIDDWVAVYLKKNPTNQPLIHRLQYTILRPSDLQYKSSFSHVPTEAQQTIIQELTRMQQENPAGVKATLALANIALRNKQFSEARTLASDATRLRPFSPEPLALVAGSFVAEERWEDAAKTYQQLLKMAGKRYPDLNREYIAQVFEKALRPWWQIMLLRWRFSLSTLREKKQGTSVSPSSASALPNPAEDALQANDAGMAHIEKGELDAAELLFRNALMLNPSFAEAWSNLCAVLISTQRATDAIEACKRAIAITPTMADAHYNLALAYYQNGSLNEAKREAHQAKKHGRTEESTTLLQLITQKQAR